MIDEQTQEIVAEVLQAIKTNSKTIAQLTSASSISDNDLVEIGGGKKITFGMLKETVLNAIDAAGISVPVSHDGSPTEFDYLTLDVATKTLSYAIFLALNTKLDSSAVVQSKGQGTSKVMSQKAVTDLINQCAQLNPQGALATGQEQRLVVTFINTGSEIVTPTVAGVYYNGQTKKVETYEEQGSATVSMVVKVLSETPSQNVVYCDKAENKLYRWDGSKMVQLSSGGGDSYTKSETDALLAGKASATSQVQMNYEEEPVEVDTNLAITLMSTGINNHIHDTDEALATKVNKNGLKTINGESIVGSGDITIEGGTKEVHVGTDEPTEGEVLWIDPNEQIIEQTTGQATDKVMSQDATTKAIATKQDKLTAGENITIENNVISANGTLRQLFVSAGAVYNSTTGYYELNGLTDITEEEMMIIYTAGSITTKGVNLEGMYSGSSLRTNLYEITGKGGITPLNLAGCFYSCKKLEVVAITSDTYTAYISCLNYGFYNCYKLKKILGILRFVGTAVVNCFGNCNLLEYLKLNGIMTSVAFPDSPNLNKESILYIINNSAATSAITITLHPTAYAMAQADTDIQTALSNHPFVTLASA